MLTLLNLGLAIAPALLLLAYFYRLDKYQKEPKALITKAFLLGFLAVVLAVLFSIPFMLGGWLERLDFWPKIAVIAFVVAGLLEECAKLIIFMKFIDRRAEFDEMTDGIIYMVTISLGFACLENIFYSYGNTTIAALRAFTAVPGHAIWSGLMGYYIGMAKFGGGNRRSLIIKGLFLAVILHGTYDFLVFSETALALLIIPFLIIGFVVLRTLIIKTREQDLAEGRVTS